MASKDALQVTFDKITAPIVTLYKQYMSQMSDKEKYSDKEDAPIEEIEVYEGEQEVKDIDKKINERYINYCKHFLDKHRLPNGEFGPYNNYLHWRYGDRLEADYSGAHAPLKIGEWKKMGYPNTADIRFSPYDTTKDEAEARHLNEDITPSTAENDKEIKNADILAFIENV